MYDRFQVRERIAESGKMRINEVMQYLDRRLGRDNYDRKQARIDAKEMIAEAKQYM